MQRTLILSLIGIATVSSFAPWVTQTTTSVTCKASLSDENSTVEIEVTTQKELAATTAVGQTISRRDALVASGASWFGVGILAATGGASGVWAAEEDGLEVDVTESESIAEKAARVAKEVEAADRENTAAATKTVKVRDSRTIYDFSVPVDGKDIPFVEFIDQTFPSAPAPVVVTEDDAPMPEPVKVRVRVKAILVVNIKQDDPIARKNIPELISIASKYGGEFAVVAVPTDQGYYEPDTSALIRLKLDREYGYGINPATHLTDKLNLLGTGAHPMMRWIEGTCRTPQGLGKIQGNFEKFLIDGTTGKPIRRYPRKYSPYDIKDDIKALIDGKPLPPAGSNFLEQWREAATDAERDTYRFQKGLNVFDQ